MRVVGYWPSFHFWKEGGDNYVGFLIELLREVAKGAMRELSAYTFKKRFLDKDNEKPPSAVGS